MMTSADSAPDGLARALTDPAGGIRPLPPEAAELLAAWDAPPRLAAHLRAVHDVACDLTQALRERFPALAFDAERVRFGAAIHDVGKVVHRGELSGPGSSHEQAGYDLLLAHGVADELARFARTHAAWGEDGVTIEDLLVSLADKVWKGKRVKDLEQLVVDRLGDACDIPAWEAFMALDDILAALAEGSDQRLAFQSSHGLGARP